MKTPKYFTLWIIIGMIVYIPLAMAFALALGILMEKILGV
jgi:hypothetical protein